LPVAPHLKKETGAEILKPAAGYNYLYRLNCGGPDYKDSFGNLWMADRHQDNSKQAGSLSWTDDYPGMPAFFASQQRTFDRITGTQDSPLFQTYRYGMNKLRFNFPVPHGDYRVELYFTEPWYGIGGGMDCTGWRLFDVAVNGETKIKNLDIWKEVGCNKVLKKTITAHVKGGVLSISFPDAEAGEAIISAIAISSLNRKAHPVQNNSGIIQDLKGGKGWSTQSWLDIGEKVYADASFKFSNLLPALYGADWIRTSHELTKASFTVKADADVFVAMDVPSAQRPQWLADFEVTGQYIETDADGGHKLPVYRKMFKKDAVVTLGNNAGKYSYTIAALPVTTLQPATDLRRTISYKAETAELHNGVTKDTLNGKNVIRFEKDDGIVSFPVMPGVGALYALRIKYYNPTSQIFTGKVQLLAADGTVMNQEQISFKPVAKNKSGTVASTSGTSINAGNYKLVISGIKLAGLYISGIEMQ
jgi:hypothetical protein